jgi:rubrerythrin
MSEQRAFEEIVQGAIQGEIESYELYTRAVNLAQSDQVRVTLQELAREEQAHKTALERLLADPQAALDGMLQFQEALIRERKTADSMPFKVLSPDSTLEDVCVFASRKEQQAYELYRGLAERSRDETREILEVLAQEELRHKSVVEGWLEKACQD